MTENLINCPGDRLRRIAIELRGFYQCTWSNLLAIKIDLTLRVHVSSLPCQEKMLLTQSQKDSEDKIRAPLNMSLLKAKLILVAYVKKICLICNENYPQINR